MKEYNIVIVGVGGQGIITLQNILSEAALLQGFEVKTSEIHGLAQRGGSVQSHVRFGEKIYSPLVLQGSANLIVGLELLETLRACYYASKENKTRFIVDNNVIQPYSNEYPKLERIKEDLKRFSEEVIVLNACEIVKRETGTSTPTNIYLLGFACSKGLIPIEKNYIFEAMKIIIPEKFFEMNKKIFELGSR
ncbi:MAG: indolepyruvate oxidoreductase subunit beta [Candidatus Aenigmatarchaeota archaeon]